MSVSVDMTSCVSCLGFSLPLHRRVCASQCEAAIVCVPAEQVKYVCRFSEYIYTGVCGTLCCLYARLGLYGSYCVETHIVFSPLASVCPVFNGVRHCVVAHVFFCRRTRPIVLSLDLVLALVLI